MSSSKPSQQNKSDQLAVMAGKMNRCPLLQSTIVVPPREISPEQEFTNVRSHYPSLASTGCTSRFCQSGRMIHTDEERVGRNKSYQQVREDALDFLQQMYKEGLLTTEQLHSRVHEVLEEIQKNSREGHLATPGNLGPEEISKVTQGLVGGNWSQTFEELEFGIRMAWKHARKCIMRSEYSNLRLCDLRHVRSSAKMAETLIENLKTAYNGGEINPTVFVFPPRDVNRRGPMIWNQQLLAFAAYEQTDGTILGDPANIALTTAILQLGWAPPTYKTRWDLLPLVTVAEGEEPTITEIPKDTFPLVHIRHPIYKELESLGLRWVPAPALSRLGFSIGGLQYTATPFIGWFMDAEIGVRNLADSFRYNALPEIARAIALTDKDVDDLPDYERLAVLSRAQLELNYATYWSFAEAGVRMSDSLGAAEQFSLFDDEHLMKRGYRLPSDPYWLAPPQGSIIPLWHRGGSPNYQPKPMICRHVQDPIKAWQRESASKKSGSAVPSRAKPRMAISQPLPQPFALSQPERQGSRIFFGFCSSGNVAIKLCKRLHAQVQQASAHNPSLGQVMPVSTLNAVCLKTMTLEDILVIVASTTGRGEIPQNGKGFADALQTNPQVLHCRYAVFGSGSLEYSDTYNQAAMDIEELLSKGNSESIMSMQEADTSSENPPWTALSQFCGQLLNTLKQDIPSTTPRLKAPHGARPLRMFDTRPWFRAKVQSSLTSSSSREGIKRVTLAIGDRPYPTMGSLWILPPNAESRVDQAMKALGIQPHEKLSFPGEPTVVDFLRYFADLEQAFKSTTWAKDFSFPLPDILSQLPIHTSILQVPSNWRECVSVDAICMAMPTIQAREYSIASDTSCAQMSSNGGRTLDLLVQHHPNGRFSDRYLSAFDTLGLLNCKIRSTPHLEPIVTLLDRPLILFTTGSGIAPVRSLLQQRLSLPLSEAWKQRISLFVGFKTEDELFIREAIEEAEKRDLFDVLKLVPSNKEKRRAQDAALDELNIKETLSRSIREKGAYVFACARPNAVEGFLGNLDVILGEDAREVLQERFVADIYRPAT